MDHPTLSLEGLSAVRGKPVIARFDGGIVSSDSGVLALAEVDQRLRVAERVARCIHDPRSPEQVVHSLVDMIGFRMKMIAAGYEDGNDATRNMNSDASPRGKGLVEEVKSLARRRILDIQGGSYRGDTAWRRADRCRQARRAAMVRAS